MSDTQRDREERQHVIEVLKSWDGYFIGYTSDEVQEALRYAINSIKTDLKYDLLYEETSGQADKPTTKNDAPDINVGNIYTCSCGFGWDKTKVVRYHFCPNCGKAVEPTTKENLGVDAVSRQAINGYIDYILSHGMGKKKSFDFIKKFVVNLPSVTPQEPRWIPVSEKLPKVSEYIGNVERYYLVQNEYGDMLVARYAHSGYWEQIYQHHPIVDKIVAWMSLPPKYER